VAASRQLVDALRREQLTTIGVGRLDGRRFLANAGIGLDAAVVLRADVRPERKRRWGALWFARCAVAELWANRATASRLAIERYAVAGAAPQACARPTDGGPTGATSIGAAGASDGGPLAAAWLVVLNRSPYSYAGRRPLDLLGEAHHGERPARPSTRDGLVAVAFERLAVPTLLVASARSALTSRGAVHGRRVRAVDVGGRLVVHASQPVPAQVDGEYVRRGQRFEFTYEPGAISVVQPTSSGV
jgi:diacylglycerol kinase family enzyme